ncbi:V-type ATP synthase subunit E [Thermodesulfobacteriota bacterium]
MAIKDIIEKIKSDAKEAAAKLKSDSDKEVSNIAGESSNQVSEVEAETKVLSKKKYDEELRLKISLATLEQKNKLLTAKQNLIDEAFSVALNNIKALDAEKYKELLIKAVLNVDIKGDEELILGSFDKDKLGGGFVDDLNSAFKKIGEKANLKLLSETRQDVTGCVLKDGRKETICTFESIIAAKRKELEQEIASLLFKE